jgi:hypothetical protein
MTRANPAACLVVLALTACAGGEADAPTDVAPSEVAWSAGLPRLSDELAPLRGRVHRRAVLHIHSPFSHDACDGHGYDEATGQIDTACRDSLRAALCTTHYDAAFVTDHPDYMSRQPFQDLFHAQPGDTWIEQDVALAVECDDGHRVTWRPGFEDELMPVGLRHHAEDDLDARRDLYNRYDADAVRALSDAGAAVMVAHTEQRDVAQLAVLQDAGLTGIEVFNLHAMFAPNIRPEFLGLDALSWLSDIGPFTAPDSELEPDLLFLAVLQSQPPSVAKWDALLARGPMVGIAGTDAHENVLPGELSDDERMDSYRRMLRWFSTVLLADGVAPADDEAALRAGRAFVAFEVLGTPAGFDFHLDSGGATVEMGGQGAPGTLVVGCPKLSPNSPRGLEAPEITITVLKDGAAWQTGCGSFEAAEPGVYRVEVSMVPNHLRRFLGADPDRYIKSYPWIYGNPIRVVAAGG